MSTVTEDPRVRRPKARWRRPAVMAVVGGVALFVSGVAVARTAGPPDPHPPAPTGPAPAPAKPSNPTSTFSSITPCRIVDTRVSHDPFGAGAARSFYVAGSQHFVDQGGKSGGCGIPAVATSIAATITAVDPKAPGYLRAWPANLNEPTASLVQFSNGTDAAGSTVAIQQTSGTSLRVKSSAATDVVIDVTGYYAPPIDGMFTSAGVLASGTGRLQLYSHTSTGYYTLKADRDLTGCVPTVSAYYYAYNASAYAGGSYVYVELVNSSDAALSDYYFNVSVVC